MSNDLIVLGQCVKGKKRKITILSLYLFTIIFVVMMVYLYMTEEEPQFKDSSYIPLCFLVLGIPFVYFIIRIAIQPKNVIFYDDVENKIYVRSSKFGVFRKRYYIFDVTKIKKIYALERPKNYYSRGVVEAMRTDIGDIPGLHFCMESGSQYVSTDFDDYFEVIIKLQEVLPIEYKDIVA